MIGVILLNFGEETGELGVSSRCETVVTGKRRGGGSKQRSPGQSGRSKSPRVFESLLVFLAFQMQKQRYQPQPARLVGVQALGLIDQGQGA